MSRKCNINSYNAAESLVDTVNFNCPSKNLKEINEADFTSIYNDKAGNSSYKETLSMLLTHYSFKEGKGINSFLGIVNRQLEKL